MSNKTDKVKFERVKHEWVPASRLKVHPQVQRGVRDYWVKEIADNIDPDRFGELSVVDVPNAGYYYIFDGQHRFLAAMREWGADQRLPCAIHEDCPLDKQAKKFLALNGGVHVKAIDRWMVRRLAQDEKVLAIEKIVAGHNLSVEASHRHGKVQAVAALESTYDRYGGGPALDRTLKILMDAWDRDPDAYESLHIKGVAFLVSRFNGDLDDRELSRKLARGVQPVQLVGQARAYAQSVGVSVERAMSEKMLSIYNKGRSKRLEFR